MTAMGLRSAGSSAVTTLVAGAGLVLLALGLRSWAIFAWQTDTSSSRSPLPYMSQVDLRGLARPAAKYDWVILARAPSAASTCLDLRSAVLTDGARIPAVLVITIDAGRADAYRCDSAAASQSVAVEALASAAPLPQGGFVLLDSRRRVASGSYLTRDLQDLPAVLRLLTHKPGLPLARE